MTVADGLTVARQAVAPNRLKRAVLKGQLAHSFSIKLIANVEVAHYAAAAGYDAILIDLEHSSFGLETCNQLAVHAMATG